MVEVRGMIGFWLAFGLLVIGCICWVSLGRRFWPGFLLLVVLAFVCVALASGPGNARSDACPRIGGVLIDGHCEPTH